MRNSEAGTKHEEREGLLEGDQSHTAQKGGQVATVKIGAAAANEWPTFGRFRFEHVFCRVVGF